MVSQILLWFMVEMVWILNRIRKKMICTLCSTQDSRVLDWRVTFSVMGAKLDGSMYKLSLLKINWKSRPIWPPLKFNFKTYTNKNIYSMCDLIIFLGQVSVSCWERDYWRFIAGGFWFKDAPVFHLSFLFFIFICLSITLKYIIKHIIKVL